MALVQRAGYCAPMALLSLVAAGCGLAKPAVRPSAVIEPLPVVAHVTPPTSAAQSQPTSTAQSQNPQASVVQQVSHRMADSQPSSRRASDGLFAGQPQLSLEQLIAEVEARNPSLQAMSFAWRAAAQRYPQAVSLDDPMFMTMMAPASFGSSQVESAYILQGSQKLPWFGKRRTRGEAAQAEAGAAFQEMQDTRLQVVQVTRLAFYDYYLAERQLEINDRNRASAQEFRDSAQVKYENNQVTQQDVIQADVELADVRRRKIELERMRRVAVARINVLLLRAPDESLPPSPGTLAPELELPPADSLRLTAMAQRPDLAALAARVRAEQAAVELALKQYYPDADVFGRYDSFWQPAATQSDLRGQVGVNMNVPIYRRKLQAAVCEAQFRLSQRQAEYQQRLVEIQYDVQAAYEQVEAARQTVDVYSKQYLPLAEQNLSVARANYDVGKTTYLNLVMAQRQLFAVRETYEQSLTDYFRRVTELERAIGGRLPASGGLEELPRPE